MIEVVIERVSTRGRGANDFARWLAQWKRLRAEGWDVTVLAARDGTHAVGLAMRERST